MSDQGKEDFLGRFKFRMPHISNLVAAERKKRGMELPPQRTNRDLRIRCDMT